MARLRKLASTGARIAVIDDDETLLGSMVGLLEHEGHEVRSANSCASGVELVRAWPPDVVLLDYHLPPSTGADVVRQIRTFDTMTQVLLVTGYASEQPARRMLVELDIQGYHDKADGPERLLVLLEAALKHRRALMRIDRQRQVLRHIVDVSPELWRLQAIDELFAAALRNASGLLGSTAGFIATENNGLLVMSGASEGVSVRAGTGRFERAKALSELPLAVAEVAMAGLAAALPTVHASGFVIIPMETRAGDRGCLVMEGRELPPDAIEPCQLYARQVMQALENNLLFERATVDPLTELYNRGFGLQRLQETMLLGRRNAKPTGLLMLDIDHFKRINDTYGHAAGDLVMREIGAVVRRSCRTTDVALRYGGEEIAIVLPTTDFDGALVIAERVRAAIEAASVTFERRLLRVTVSVGVAASGPDEIDPADVLRRADLNLYEAKSGGRNRVSGAVIAWKAAS